MRGVKKGLQKSPKPGAVSVWFGTLGVWMFLILSSSYFSVPALHASEDWYQYHGPQRDRISTESDWNAEWGAEGPPVKWRAQVGIGFSSIAVRDGKVFTMGNTNDEDTVWCFDADTGKVIWKFSYPCELFPNMHEGGPGGTPTVSETRVYTISKDGQMYCLDVNSGEQVWFHDLKKLLNTEMPRWRFANSPYLEEGKLIVDAGVIAALEPETGRVIWKTKNYGSAYSSAVVFDVHGRRCIVALPESGLVLLDAASGKELGFYPWETMYGINAATPVVHENKVFISSGYNKGAALLAVDDNFSLQEIWNSREMRNQLNASVYWEGHLYGFDESMLKCLNFNTGEEKWRKRGLGKGSLMLAGDKLIILSERGTLVIAEATPDEYQEISQAQVLEGRCWTVPVLADQKIYCRNAEGDFICVDVSNPS
ncbi:MAG: PQQ-binding-like beta-propeller repeat protein [bacterium]